MIFNSDLSKQAQEVIFSGKTNNISCLTTTFNVVAAAGAPCQKHPGLCLDETVLVNMLM